MRYDVIIIGAGPGGIFSAYELSQKSPDLKVGANVPLTGKRSNPVSAARAVLL